MATKKTERSAKSETGVSAERKWEPTPQAKGKATRNRVLAFIFWILAIAAEAFTIFYLLNRTYINLFLLWLIIALVVIAGLAIAGNLLWKQANKYDPASEKNKVKFFINNQLGVIMTMIAFIPLIVLIFMNKDMDGKTKGIAGAVAIILFVVAGFLGIDFEQPSQEQYAKEANYVEGLTGQDLVYWAPTSTKYHLYEDCQHIANSEVSSGTVGDAFAARNLDATDPRCQTCENNYMREHPEKQSVLDEIKRAEAAADADTAAGDDSAGSSADDAAQEESDAGTDTTSED